jgi:methyltransferase family protein
VPAPVDSWQQVSEFIHSIPSTTCGGSQPEFLYQLSKQTQGKGEIVEIGTYIGRSTIAIAYAQKEKGGPPINTIDIDRHPDLDGNLRRAGVEDFVDLTVETSTIAEKRWEKPIEFLWIDADHARVGLAADIRAWCPHVIVGGMVAFHDYPGVDSSRTVWKPISKMLFGDPLNWRMVSDREHGTIVVFERLEPDPRFTGRPSLKQRLKWTRREVRAWVRLRMPRFYAFLRRFGDRD